MAEARFVKGNQEMVDYTPTAKVDAGDVVLVGSGTNKLCLVALREIPANQLGALCKNGQFMFDKTAGFSASYGDKALFDESTRKLVETGGVAIGVYVPPDSLTVASGDTQALVAINQTLGTSEDESGS